MRLIDADALRQAILSMMPERSEVLLIVDNQPEGIVRCKDCKYGKPQMGEIYCEAHEEIGYDPEPTHPLDWFCADGERKEGDGDGT